MWGECSAQEEPFSHLLVIIIRISFACGPGGAALPFSFASHLPAAPAVPPYLFIRTAIRRTNRRGEAPRPACKWWSGPAGSALPFFRLPSRQFTRIIHL